MSGYAYFAEFYDTLTQNVGYEERAEYLLSLFRHHNHTPGLTLDLACGTGSLTLALHRRGVDIFGADASSEMLSLAQQKFMEDERQTLFLCQKMRHSAFRRIRRNENHRRFCCRRMYKSSYFTLVSV